MTYTGAWWYLMRPHAAEPTPHGRLPREIVVTSALPYANDPIYLGPLVEYIDSGPRAKGWRIRPREKPCTKCSVCLRGFQYLSLWLKPVLPSLALRVEAFLNCGELSFADEPPPLVPYEHLLTRIEPKRIAALVMETPLHPHRRDPLAPGRSRSPPSPNRSRSRTSARWICASPAGMRVK
ncbi:MAG: hypothetical protein M3461_12480 [Pseudomonadota bacterium]|nr:hypothetical protein [Pseudomonadota bacterium]